MTASTWRRGCLYFNMKERLFVFSTWMRVCLRSTSLLSINVPTSSRRSPVGSNCASLNLDCCFRADKGEDWIWTALKMRFNVNLILFRSHLHLYFLSEKYPCLFLEKYPRLFLEKYPRLLSEKSRRKQLCFSKPGLLLSSRQRWRMIMKLSSRFRSNVNLILFRSNQHLYFLLEM